MFSKFCLCARDEWSAGIFNQGFFYFARVRVFNVVRGNRLRAIGSIRYGNFFKTTKTAALQTFEPSILVFSSAWYFFMRRFTMIDLFSSLHIRYIPTTPTNPPEITIKPTTIHKFRIDYYIATNWDEVSWEFDFKALSSAYLAEESLPIS